ncbi:hypothetical protein VIGAN_07202900 [Vigna angularis var. angularis]|uniref:Uncharacterized protein n=1 Tax=Vigna angularis var. angularis TaxID=157739 RepID=A0A0S3SJY8_PHAAN|nr:hypothetical protein VIGAN_07202900 [Vigna angularis var. angularis]
MSNPKISPGFILLESSFKSINYLQYYLQYGFHTYLINFLQPLLLIFFNSPLLPTPTPFIYASTFHVLSVGI